ncbi:hypothetical protein QR680_012579 [Steinernema hermaphroditum]|uniref:Serine/threonine-protein phosphatase n=1 Tax=Steinernema hermaphroditum TaxID=289476 RepID=A0AA39I4G3_9BILA|nr:hypothetical protein QR680_012579 [Steinernema hermaphroditum]
MHPEESAMDDRANTSRHGREEMEVDIPEEFTSWDVSTPEEHSRRYLRFVSDPIKRRMLDDIIEKCFDVFGKDHNEYYLIRSKKVSRGQYVEVTKAAGDLFMCEPMLLEVEAPITICGDIHGQLHDLLRILLTNPTDASKRSRYLFLGDYVDRGPQSLEVVLLLFCLKVRYPQDFFLLRGNHEFNGINGDWKWFYGECLRELGSMAQPIFSHTNAIFNCLPVAAVVAGRIICAHGGISPFLHSLDRIRRMKRPCSVPEGGLLTDILWSDPSRDSTQLEWSVNSRGCSVCFGENAVDRFLQRFDFDFICRAHEYFQEGFKFFFGRKVLTIFSAPFYSGTNKAAVLKVSETLACSIKTFIPLADNSASRWRFERVMDKAKRQYRGLYKEQEARRPQDFWDSEALLWVVDFVDSLAERQ